MSGAARPERRATAARMRTGKRRQQGFSYLLVLLLIGLIGLGLAAAGSVWRTESQREREAELLFIGAQYRQAIQQFYQREPDRPRFPQSLDELLEDPRGPQPARHLRKRWRDPFGGELQLIRMPDGQGIAGVHSGSALRPLKQTGFPPGLETLEQAASLRDWHFVFVPPARTPAAAP